MNINNRKWSDIYKIKLWTTFVPQKTEDEEEEKKKSQREPAGASRARARERERERERERAARHKTSKQVGGEGK